MLKERLDTKRGQKTVWKKKVGSIERERRNSLKSKAMTVWKERTEGSMEKESRRHGKKEEKQRGKKEEHLYEK